MNELAACGEGGRVHGAKCLAVLAGVAYSVKLPLTLGTGLARTGTNTGTPREPPKRLLRAESVLVKVFYR